jgi:hypothetical protein
MATTYGRVIKIKYINNNGTRYIEFFIELNNQQLYLTTHQYCRPIRDNNTGAIIKSIKDIVGTEYNGTGDANGYVFTNSNSKFYDQWTDLVNDVNKTAKESDDKAVFLEGEIEAGIYDNSPNGNRMFLLKSGNITEILCESNLSV